MTLWTVFTDVCLMGMVFLAGQILRAKVKIFQKFLIPPALIAGFLAPHCENKAIVSPSPASNATSPGTKDS